MLFQGTWIPGVIACVDLHSHQNVPVQGLSGSASRLRLQKNVCCLFCNVRQIFFVFLRCSSSLLRRIPLWHFLSVELRSPSTFIQSYKIRADYAPCLWWQLISRVEIISDNRYQSGVASKLALTWTLFSAKRKHNGYIEDTVPSSQALAWDLVVFLEIGKNITGKQFNTFNKTSISQRRSRLRYTLTGKKKTYN